MDNWLFDEFAEAYDGWFLENRTVLESEVRLLARALQRPGRTLSVGCGTGLFEQILHGAHGIDIRDGVEPSEAMAEVARKRGMSVKAGRAEELPYGEGEMDTVLFNGSPGYIEDLEGAFREAHRVLRPSGRVVVLDVPAESGYGLLYMLAAAKGTWNDPVLRAVAPSRPYPVELAAGARWRTTEEKARLLERAGFTGLEYLQTLTRHPRFTNDEVEDPVPGYDRGGYVAITARKA